MPRQVSVSIDNIDPESLSAKRAKMFQEMSRKGLLPAESDRLNMVIKKDAEARAATFAGDSEKQQFNLHSKSEEDDGDDTEPVPNENEDAEPSLPIVRLNWEFINSF